MNKQNDFSLASAMMRPNSFVFTTKNPASVIMLVVVASSGNKMSPVWFPMRYKLIAGDYKEF